MKRKSFEFRVTVRLPEETFKGRVEQLLAQALLKRYPGGGIVFHRKGGASHEKGQ